MPLSARSVSPVDLSRNRLPAFVQKDELQCVANGTLANVIRQLSSLCRHAEQIFAEVHRETLKIDHRTNTLFLRVEKLGQKIAAQADQKLLTDLVSLEGAQMRKAFKSNMIVDQHSLDRQTLPHSLQELYQRCDQPPRLNDLNAYREDSKEALKYYTDPGYFFDLWRQEMLKEIGINGGGVRGGGNRSARSPSGDRKNHVATSKALYQQQQKQVSGGFQSGGGQRPHNSAYNAGHLPVQPVNKQSILMNYYSSGFSQKGRQANLSASGLPLSTSQGGQQTPRGIALSPPAILHFPDEYQAPQNLRLTGTLQPAQAPPGMHVPSNTQIQVGAQQQHSTQQHFYTMSMEAPTQQNNQQSNPLQQIPPQQIQQKNAADFVGVGNGGETIAREERATLPPPCSDKKDGGGALGGVEFFGDDDDDELPPPPPSMLLTAVEINKNSNAIQQQPMAAAHIQFVPTIGGCSNLATSTGITTVKQQERSTDDKKSAEQDVTENSASVRIRQPIPPPPLLAPANIFSASFKAADSEEQTKTEPNNFNKMQQTEMDGALKGEKEEEIGEPMQNATLEPKKSIASPSNSSAPQLTLMEEIKAGIQLRKVARREEEAQARAATQDNDVAAILRRRMEHCLGITSDESSPSPCGSNENDWDD